MMTSSAASSSTPTKSSKSKTLSLVNPDFSGLYSVARIGHQPDKKWYSKILGTIIIAMFVYSWIGGFLVPFWILYLFCAGYYSTAIIMASLIVLPYIVHFDPSPMISRLYIVGGSHYFDGGSTFSVEHAYPKSRSAKHGVLVAGHPHGILCLGYFLCCGIRARCIQGLDRLRLDAKQTRAMIMKFAGKMGLNAHYLPSAAYAGTATGYLVKAPIFNFLIVQLTGCVESASKRNIKRMMAKQMSFGILPGGFNEATAFNKGEELIYIKHRKGFIKYSLQCGYEVIPLYIFGESQTYSNLLNFSDNIIFANIKQWLNKHSIPTVFPVGPYWFTPLFLLPNRKIGLHSVMATGIMFPQITNPTQAQIDKYHQLYMTALISLFDRNKWRFGMENVILKVL